MGNRLYVGNIPFDADEAQIRSFFEGFTVTKVNIVTDRESGRPRGFAFVDLAGERDAQKAIADLNGLEMGGRSIVVNEAREKPRGNGGGSNGGYGDRNGGGGGGGRGNSGNRRGRDRDRDDDRY